MPEGGHGPVARQPEVASGEGAEHVAAGDTAVERPRLQAGVPELAVVVEYVVVAQGQRLAGRSVVDDGADGAGRAPRARRACTWDDRVEPAPARGASVRVVALDDFERHRLRLLRHLDQPVLDLVRLLDDVDRHLAAVLRPERFGEHGDALGLEPLAGELAAHRELDGELAGRNLDAIHGADLVADADRRDGLDRQVPVSMLPNHAFQVVLRERRVLLRCHVVPPGILRPRAPPFAGCGRGRWVARPSRPTLLASRRGRLGAARRLVPPLLSRARACAFGAERRSGRGSAMRR